MRTLTRLPSARIASALGMLLASTLVACQAGLSNDRHATATMFDASGRQVGVVELTGTTGMLTVAGQFQGLAAGQHGIHFHAVGQCDAAAAFASAGPHFNPATRKHGLDNPDGPHAGDLPNLSIAENGTGSFRASSTRATLGKDAGSLLDADGTAIVVHAAADDQRTDPSGNSGARVACGVVKAS